MKDFSDWHSLKIDIDSKIETDRLFFKEGYVWWVHLGLNVGFEMNGKDREFIRPVVVIKKYNKFSFLALPLTTKKKENKYIMYVGNIDSRESYANLSQLRNIDSKRLLRKHGALEKFRFKSLKRKTSQINFG